MTTQIIRPNLNERLRQITVDHHDEQRHDGPQRFCREAPCRELNTLLADWEVW